MESPRSTRSRALTSLPTAASFHRREVQFREHRQATATTQSADSPVQVLHPGSGQLSPSAGAVASAMRNSFFGAPPPALRRRSSANPACPSNTSMTMQAGTGSFAWQGVSFANLSFAPRGEGIGGSFAADAAASLRKRLLRRRSEMEKAHAAEQERQERRQSEPREQPPQPEATKDLFPEDDDGDNPEVARFTRGQRKSTFLAMFLTILFANYDSGALAAMYGHEPQQPSVVVNASLECENLWYDFLSLAEGTGNYKALAACETPPSSAAAPLIGAAARARSQNLAIQEAMEACAAQSSTLGQYCRLVYPDQVPLDLFEVTSAINSPVSSSAAVGDIIIANENVSCAASNNGLCYKGRTVHGHRGDAFPSNQTRYFRASSRPVTLVLTHSGTWDSAAKAALLAAVAAAMNVPQPDPTAVSDANSVGDGVVDVEIAAGQRRVQVRFLNLRDPRGYAAALVSKCSSSPACLGSSYSVTSAEEDSATWGELAESLLHDSSFGRLYATKALQGFLGSIVYIGLAIGSILSGWALENYPPRTVLSLSLAINIVFAWVFAASVSRTQLFFSRFLVGISQSTLVAYCPIWVTEFAPKDSQGIWLSLIMAGVPLGIVVGYVVAGMIAQNTSWPWYWAFYIQGLCLVPLAVFLFALPSAWHVKASAPRVDEEKESGQDGEPRMRARTVSEGVKELFRNTTLWYAVMALSSLYFVVNSLQTWVTPYLTDECTPVTESLGTVIVSFGITAVTGPVFGVILGGTSLDCVGGYTGNLPRAAALGSFYGLIAALCGWACLAVTNFWAFICLIWLTLVFGGAVVPAATGVVLACVDEDLRKLVSAYAAVHYNIWGFNLGPLLVGVLASAAQSEPACAGSLADACLEIGCLTEVDSQGGCASPHGLTWGFRLGMGWSLGACLLMVATWRATVAMVRENDERTRSYWMGPNGESVCVFYQIAGVWAWRHETIIEKGPQRVGDGETRRKVVPCCWVTVRLGEQLPTAQLGKRSLYIDAFMLPLLPFKADDDLHLSDDPRLDSAVCGDPVTLEDVDLSDYVHWRVTQVVSQGGRASENVSTVAELQAFVSAKTQRDDTVLIVLQDGRLWDAYLEPEAGFFRHPRCCCGPHHKRVDLLAPCDGTEPASPTGGDRHAVCGRRRDVLQKVLRSYGRKRFTADLIRELEVELPEGTESSAVLTLVYTKGIDDPLGRSLKARYQQAFKDHDLEAMQKYLELMKRRQNANGRPKILVIDGEDESVQNDFQVNPDITVGDFSKYLEPDDDSATDSGGDRPPRKVLWLNHQRLDPAKRLQDYKIRDGAVLTLRLPSWQPEGEPDAEVSATIQSAPPDTQLPRRRQRLSEEDRASMNMIADREQYTAQWGLQRAPGLNPGPGGVASWVSHLACCRAEREKAA
eukprot:TRINITY_DN26571_c0_g1_i1.p1 TRINITY_DN26571_c0_g1~~TRINITY_DN26571_c0_g1_i1.p1  ORF type:complete len:1415 (+),score=321.85 TRINITY_DN26571_c0_g1_i1:64-4245(+)